MCTILSAFLCTCLCACLCVIVCVCVRVYLECVGVCICVIAYVCACTHPHTLTHKPTFKIWMVASNGVEACRVLPISAYHEKR